MTNKNTIKSDCPICHPDISTTRRIKKLLRKICKSCRQRYHDERMNSMSQDDARLPLSFRIWAQQEAEKRLNKMLHGVGMGV